MRKGESVSATAFFKLLIEDDEFCKQLGRAVLAAGQLESEVKLFLSRNEITQDTKKKTLGNLIELLKSKKLLSKVQPVLEQLRDQRNYLTHNIHALFAGLVEETILPRTDLLDSDVDVFMERALQLAENLLGLADAVARQHVGTG
jgi:hypothetical protein